MGDVHVCSGGDVDRGQVDGPGDGDWVLQVDWRRDVDRAGGDVHLSCDGDRVTGVSAAVHSRGDGCRVGYGRGGGRVVVHVVGIFIVAGAVEAGLAVRLQVTGDVGGAQHLTADVAGDFTFMSDHV